MTTQPDEDLFENSRMSFGEHLEELRKRLIYALIGVAIAGVVGFYIADYVVAILVQPLSDAANQFEKEAAEKRIVGELGYVPPEYQPLLMEGFVPVEWWTDPGVMVVNLQSVVPDFGAKLDLDVYGFRAEHFKPDQIISLAQRLESQTGTTETATEKLAALWNLMTETEQTQVGQIANTPSMTEDEQQQATLQVMAIFNRLTRVEELYQDSAFTDDVEEVQPSFLASMFSEPEKRPLADLKSTLDDPATNADERPNVLRRLNRAIVASLFPDELNKIQLGLKVFPLWKKTEFRPQALSPTEGFFVWLKAGLFTSLTLAGPWMFYQIWSFVAAGLYPHEKKYIYYFLPISVLLFACGVALAYYFVFQPVLGFLFSFNRSLGIAPQMRIGEWLSFALFLPLGFGVAFQLPLVMLFLNRIDLIQVDSYVNQWRVAVMIIFVLSMFLTPADPISLLLLALPLCFLYFLGIGMCYWMPAPKNPFDE